ncbi:WXG100 family type VII secretion target [Streptomyces lydicus]|uniref:WXG100 family type VII secretion target n=1 Tax=Streptomyces lydicus TaxID=47763 RepID=UPI0009FF9519|nr:WXG100 family type VII secretion target [Streptomyces lydicus]
MTARASAGPDRPRAVRRGPASKCTSIRHVFAGGAGTWLRSNKVTTPTSVTVEGMNAALGAFREADSTARAQLSAMQEQVSVLTSNWTGDAAARFGGAMHTWLEDFQTVVTALDRMVNTLEQNTGVYRSTHDSTEQAASNLASRMHAPLSL